MEIFNGALKVSFCLRAKAWLWVHNWWCSYIKATLCRWKRNEWTNPLQLKWSLYVQRTITPAIWVRMVKCFHRGVVTTFMTWLLYNMPVFSCVDGSGCFVCESYLWERDRLKSRESSHKCHVLLISGYKAGRPRFARLHVTNSKAQDFYGLLLLPLWSRPNLTDLSVGKQVHYIPAIIASWSEAACDL